MEPKRRLAYGDFYRMQIVAKKTMSRGHNGRVSRVSGNKTFFFFGLKVQMTDLYSCCFNSALKLLFQGS